jgi:hypothetical protein
MEPLMIMLETEMGCFLRYEEIYFFSLDPSQRTGTFASNNKENKVSCGPTYFWTNLPSHLNTYYHKIIIIALK